MRVSFLALVLLGTMGVAMAQSPPPPSSGEPPGAAHRMERLATLLDLTDAQKAQVKTILETEHAKLRAQFQAAQASGTKPTFEQMHAAREQLKAETVQQLTPVLSATQLKKFEVLMEDDHGPGGGPHGGHGPRGQSSADTPPASPN
jgi:Spy/CpxP family protein refolding chaperone